MTVPDTAAPVGVPAAAPARSSAVRGTRLALLLGGVFVLLAATRAVTGQDDLTASGTLGAALGLAVPIGLAGLGGLWSERAGVVNIGLEGMMIFGTWFGAWAAYFGHDPWLGLLAGVLGGVLGGLLHAVATVTFGVDHIISGVAVNILAQGLCRFLSIKLFQGQPGGGAGQSPQLPGFPTWSVPGVDAWCGAVEKHHWFLVSDLAGLVRGLTSQVSVLTVLAVALVPVSYWVLWRTAFGLRLRSCGENPVAAESLGVPVYRMKYAAVLVSGALAGLGGVFLAMVASSGYQEGQTGGRGYIGLAAMIFGNWRVGGLAAGAGLFGYTDALQLRGSTAAVHALLLIVAAGLVAIAVVEAVRRRYVAAGLSLVAAALVLVWFLVTDELPRQLVTYTPHITTLLVLALASQRLRMPAADGQRYRKGTGG